MASIKKHMGDDGTTGILGGARLSKNHPKIEALGDLDETSAALGLARALCTSEEGKNLIIQVQRDLYTIMAEVATEPGREKHFASLDPSRIEWLEKQIETLSAQVPPVTGFILPGDTPAGGAISLARTIVRRAERHITGLFSTGDLKNPELIKYLNRLSTLCFSMELIENSRSGINPTRAKT
jgi:cob(I)alamin adenosyltransferase